MGTCGKGEGLFGESRGAADLARLEHAIDAETQEVIAGLGVHLPVERQGAGPGGPGLEVGLPIVRGDGTLGTAPTVIGGAAGGGPGSDSLESEVDVVEHRAVEEWQSDRNGIAGIRPGRFQGGAIHGSHPREQWHAIPQPQIGQFLGEHVADRPAEDVAAAGGGTHLQVVARDARFRIGGGSEGPAVGHGVFGGNPDWFPRLAGGRSVILDRIHGEAHGGAGIRGRSEPHAAGRSAVIGRGREAGGGEERVVRRIEQAGAFPIGPIGCVVRMLGHHHLVAAGHVLVAGDGTVHMQREQAPGPGDAKPSHQSSVPAGGIAVLNQKILLSGEAAILQLGGRRRI